MADESILTTTKKLLGLTEDYEEFDTDVIMHINSAFATLNQLGVGPANSLFITDKTTPWTDFIQDQANINSVKTYIFYKVKLAFDPPTTSFAIESIKAQTLELEWRLNVVMENQKMPPVDTGSGGSGGGTPIGSQDTDGVWNLTGAIDFPEEAKVGDVGVDYVTGDVWRKD